MKAQRCSPARFAIGTRSKGLPYESDRISSGWLSSSDLGLNVMIQPLLAVSEEKLASLTWDDPDAVNVELVQRLPNRGKLTSSSSTNLKMTGTLGPWPHFDHQFDIGAENVEVPAQRVGRKLGKFSA